MNHGLKPAHWEAILEVLRKHPRVQKAILFGSRAMGTFTKESDIDLCLVGDELTLDDQAELLAEFEKLPMAQTVDLVLEKKIDSPAFLEHVRKEGRTVFERQGKGSGMGGEWRELSVAEIAAQSPNAMVTGPFGSSISSRFFQSRGVPVIRGSNLTDTVGERLNDEGLVFLTPDKATEFSRSVARRGDLVFTCWGTIGQVGLIDHRARYDEYIISNKQMKLTPDPSRFDSLFLYYVFSSPAVSDEIKNQSIGSSVPGFNLRQLKAVRPRVPPLAEQRAIARILGALDDKIELNRKMNATLEAMARALFKSWFVDFDPVRAKTEGRAPSGMDAETAKLFPSEFVDSELGPIPKGWRATTLGTEVERCGGAVQTGPFGSQLHASDYVPEGVPVVMPKDIGGRRVSTASIARVREHDALRLSRHRLQPGDVVYSRRGDVERHALIGARETGWLCGTGCLLVRLGPNWPSPMFASFALDRPETRAWISRASPRLDRRDRSAPAR